jgi:arginyl-tRNA synthetase
MAQDVKTQLAALLQQALASVAPTATDTPIQLERPRDPSHGDFASNLAMLLAKALKKSPREIAQQLVRELPPSTLVTAAEVAGAGFINFRLAADSKTGVVKAVLAEAAAFGRSTAGGKQKVQVEFVSANPTGPLHVGHGRGAAYGASLSALLSFAGWDVTREYYVNDAGRQMDILGLSTWLRYLDQHGQTVAFPPNAYQGDYVREMAKQMTVAHGDKFVRAAADVEAGTPGLPEAGRADDEAKQQRELHLDALIAKAKELLAGDWHYVHQHALNEQLEDCRDDLKEFGVEFEVWYSEKSLYDTGLVARCVALLEEKGHIYVQNGAKWFRSTAFGDEKDRVVQRENGLFLFRLGHRLPPEQVRARFRQGHQHLGRRPPRLHPACYRRDQGARPRQRQVAGGAGAVRRALPQRPEGVDVHALRRIRYPARTAPRSRQRRLPLLLRAAQVRPAP